MSSADWVMALDEETNMNLTVGVRNEYQSDVDPGTEHNDFRIVAGLQFDF